MESVLETGDGHPADDATENLSRTQCNIALRTLTEKRNVAILQRKEITFISKCRSMQHLAKFFEKSGIEAASKSNCEISANVSDNEGFRVESSHHSSLSPQKKPLSPIPISKRNSDGSVQSPGGKTPTPTRLRNSLGACSGGKDMSWTSSMETPICFSTPCRLGSRTSSHSGFKRKRTSSGEVRKRVLFESTGSMSPDILSPTIRCKRSSNLTSTRNSQMQNTPDPAMLSQQNTPKRVANKITPKSIMLSPSYEDCSTELKTIVCDDTIWEDDFNFEHDLEASNVLRGISDVDDDDNLIVPGGSSTADMEYEDPEEPFVIPAPVVNFFTQSPGSDGLEGEEAFASIVSCGIPNMDEKKDVVEPWKNYEDQVPQFQAVSCGFLTGKGKSIQVSAAALEKTKKLFEDIDTWEPNQPLDVSKTESPQLKKNLESAGTRKTDSLPKFSTPIAVQKVPAGCGFSTASGKKVIVSEEALKAAKANWDSTVEQFPDNTPPQLEPKLNIQEPSPTVGSVCTFPIDNSPKLESAQVPVCEFVPVIKSAVELQLERIMAKNGVRVGPMRASDERVTRDHSKRVTLRRSVGNKYPNALACDKLLNFGVAHSTMNFRIANAPCFEFTTDDRYWPDGCVILGKYLLISSVKNRISADDICRAFLDMEGVDLSLVSKEWVINHFKWIMWKLAATEVSFPDIYGGILVNPENVLSQLERRYILEIDESKRSALKRIVERDDSSAKTLVLCVSAIELPQTGYCPEVVRLELTDGWYAIKALGDSALCRIAMKRKIRVGDKIVTHGAELFGCPSGCPPLEAPSSMYLKLHANSTRRARWDTKLGYLRNPEPFPVPLSSLFADGGMVSRCDIIISRVYPMQFFHRNASGKYIFASEAKSDRLQTQMRKEWQKSVEEIRAEVQKTFQHKIDECEKRMAKNGCNNMDNEQQFFELNKRLVDEYEQVVKLEMEKRKVSSGIEAERILKVRVIGTHSQDVDKKTSCVLSIWKPGEDVVSLISEGKSFSIYYLNVCNSKSRNRGLDIELRASQRSIYKNLNGNLDHFLPREVTCLRAIETLGFAPVHNEADIVGVVVYIGEAPCSDNNGFQTIYLSDEHGSLVGVKFWGGLKAFCVENVIEMRSLLLASNLQWRSIERKARFPCLHASEYSCFTRKPKNPIYQNAIANLQRNIQDFDALVDDAFGKICAVPSPARNNLSLDKSSSNSSASKKLAYLRHYKEPPPLPPIVANSSSFVTRDYHSPVVTGN